MSRLSLFAGILAVFILAAAAPASAASEPRVAIPGGEAPGLGAADRLGDEGGSEKMTVQLALKLRNQADLAARIGAINNSRSPEFGRHLTPAQFAADYGPTPAAVDTAVAFLRASGLRVESVSANSMLVDATGTVSTVEGALGIRIGRYRDRHTGASFFANDSTPILPASVATVVQGVHGLDNHYRLRHPALTQLPRVGSGPNGGYTPAELRGAYGFTAAPLTSVAGTGQSVGLLELDDYDQAHIDIYDRQYLNPLPPKPVRVPVDGGVSSPGTGQIEVELDIEVAHAIAPGATVVVYETANSTPTLNDAYSRMVTDGAHANSTSWGLCEADQGVSETQTLDGIFMKAAAQGLAFFAASGDSGAYDCYTSSRSLTPAVDSPASDPYVTGAGGTSLALNPNGSYQGETAWGRSGPPTPEGSGGGNSIIWAQPTWQSGVHQTENTANLRQVPDVALDADPNTGYSVYTVDSQGVSRWRVVAGTSAAAPAWAAFSAIHDQYACSQGLAALGSPNPQLYAVAGSTSFQPFNDITTGNSGTQTFWPAKAGWDYATGLGSLRAADMAQALAAAASPASAPHVTRIGTGPGPGAGPPLGGNQVDVYGCGFQQSGNNPPMVTFAGQPSPQVIWVNSGHLTAIVPPHNGGLVDVGVTNPSGIRDLTRSAYLYTASTGGYNILTSAGAIYSFGTANYFGNLIDHGYPGPAVGLAATPNGGGYSILNSGGGIYTFGNANYFGNLIDHGYPGPAVALSYTPTGGGYAILNSGGGIYIFGDAGYFGNLIDHGYPGTAVSLAFTPTGRGYLILTSTGAIYSFGDAPYFGNLLDHGYPGVAVSLNMTRSGAGYRILTTSGALYSFGDAPYYGNLLDHGYPGPAAAISDTP